MRYALRWFLPVGLLAAACGRAPELPAGTARNALLITLDTTRRNALSSFGCPVPSTPCLDRLAAESVCYDQCRAVAPITLPSHASMMTGLYPARHGVRTNGGGALPEAALTLAERARAAGIETVAFVAALVLDREFGLDQGFQQYDQPARPPSELSSQYTERSAREVVDAAVAWLEARASRSDRFLAWVHLFDPHAPWEPEQRFLDQVTAPDGRALLYLGEVAAMDSELGRLFAALRAGGHLEDTAVLVVADHGEALYEHGEPTHAAFVYDSTLRVPLFVRYPDGHRRGERSQEITSVVDVAPTLADALGLEALPGVDGVSLWRRNAPPDRGVYFESYYGFFAFGWAPLAGWADAEGKYIHSPRPELYLPREDLEEAHDVVDLYPARVAGYRAHMAELAGLPSLPPARAVTGAELQAGLAALGYATAGARAADVPDPLEPSDRPAPSTRVQELRRFLEAEELFEQGQLKEAVRILDEIVAENPGHASALDDLGLAFVMVKGWDQAIVILERRLSLAEGSCATFSNLAVAYENTGRLEDALTLLERARELSPSSPGPRDGMVRVLEKLGRTEEAAELRAAEPPRGARAVSE